MAALIDALVFSTANVTASDMWVTTTHGYVVFMASTAAPTLSSAGSFLASSPQSSAMENRWEWAEIPMGIGLPKQGLKKEAWSI
ncbi:hypothetical protein GUJ93_ZPchr0012g20645 [Zizania palustris]|uniref:Uncharacterized protein n=1 Tax=Zizania palustris TaxID=103762 RepID=A0A8J5WNH9_ZIZPA|nr:hypothetical protein GUJ93_ZPchr0012g20645 [Zizania palustris]